MFLRQRRDHACEFAPMAQGKDNRQTMMFSATFPDATLGPESIV